MKKQKPADSVFSFSHIGKKRESLELDKARESMDERQRFSDMYRDKNFPAFLKTEFFEKTQFFPFCHVRKYMAGYIITQLAAYSKVPEIIRSG